MVYRPHPFPPLSVIVDVRIIRLTLDRLPIYTLPFRMLSYLDIPFDLSNICNNKS